MDGQPGYSSELSPFDMTLEAPLSPATAESLPGPRMALVRGSGQCLSQETQCLLRSRLRAAALVMCLGFAAHFVWSLLELDLARPEFQALLACHAALTIFLGLIGANLCRSCAMSTRTLRIKELVVFSLPAALFVMMNVVRGTASARLGYVPTPAEGWLMLIFTYALFIPNTWRRAALVIGPMAAVPVLVMLGEWRLDLYCAKFFNGNPGFVAELAIIMLIAAVVSVAGVHVINILRIEAFQARQLGQYKLRERIGGGGMGEVYLAEHQLMKRPCAIKIIRPAKAGDPRVLARFEREVRATAKLSHWNSIEIFDYGRSEDGTFYYVMEYLPGMNLQELVDRFGPLPPERVIYLLRQTCDALSEAHQQGLIHRDIKPANIFAAQRGGLYDVAKLLDFGLAKALTDNVSIQLTQTGTITGSPLFMAPEQALDHAESDVRSDIYALGVVAYFLLTGRPPFYHEQPLKLIMAHANEPVVPPSHWRPDIPDDLQQVVLRCLEKDPDRRFQDAASLAEALAGCEAAGRWDRHAAARWWQSNGEPRPVAETAEV